MAVPTPLISYAFNSSNFGQDGSGSGLDATSTDVTLVTDPERGPVGSFNGTTSVVELPQASVPASLEGLLPRTYTFWAKSFNDGLIRNIVQPGGFNSQNTFRLEMRDNNTLRLDFTTVTSNPGSTMLDSTWHHISMSTDGTTVQFHFDGVPKNPIARSLNTVPGGIFVGGSQLTTLNWFLGYMSDFRAFDFVLDDRQVIADMTNTSQIRQPIIAYAFNTSSLGQDISGSGLDATSTDVTLATDPERGSVGSFNGTTSVVELPEASVPASLEGVSPRTYTFWAKSFNDSSTRNIVQASSFETNNTFRLEIRTNNSLLLDYRTSTLITGDTMQDSTWHHISMSTDGTTVRFHFDGVPSVTQTRSLNTLPSGIFVGGSDRTTLNWFLGYISDFRAYDIALSDAEVLDDMTLVLPPIFSATPWSTFLEVAWPAVSGTVYRVTYVESGSSSGEATINVNEETTTTIYNLPPNISYDIKVYSSTNGTVFSLLEEGTFTTLTDTSSNSNISHFETNGVYDFTSLDQATLDILSVHTGGTIVTGDKVRISVQGRGVLSPTFIERGATSPIGETDSVIIPFESTGGSSQTVTFTLSDNSTIVVTYDENSSELDVGGTTRTIGESFILDGRKVTIIDA